MTAQDRASWSLNNPDFTGWNFTENVMYRANLYWDVNSLSWVKATGGAIPGANVNITNFPAVQPVSATSWPLPTGASTEATLATRVADATITARLNTLGQKTMAASAPVVLASDHSTINTHTLGFDDHYGTSQYLAPNGEVVALPLYKLLGDVFTGAAIDPNFWTTTLGTGGSVAITAGQLVVSTGTTANNAVEVTSNQIARFSGLAPNKLRIVQQMPDTGVVNNIRHWGVGTFAGGVLTNGAFFQMNGTNFELTTVRSSVTSTISNGTFNGQYGTTFTPGTTAHFYEIVYQPRQVIWLADGKIIHTLSAINNPWADNIHLPIHFGSVNSGGSTTNVSFYVRNATIVRFGISEIEPDSAFIQGLNAGQNLKNTPGNLHGVTISGVTNNAVVTLYDNTTATGTILWTTGAMSNNTVPLDYQMNKIAFNVGLSIAITGAACNALVKYE